MLLEKTDENRRRRVDRSASPSSFWRNCQRRRRSPRTSLPRWPWDAPAGVGRTERNRHLLRRSRRRPHRHPGGDRKRRLSRLPETQPVPVPGSAERIRARGDRSEISAGRSGGSGRPSQVDTQFRREPLELQSGAVHSRLRVLRLESGPGGGARGAPRTGGLPRRQCQSQSQTYAGGAGESPMSSAYGRNRRFSWGMSVQHTGSPLSCPGTRSTARFGSRGIGSETYKGGP